MCSALPLYRLARTNRKYTCEGCILEKYNDPYWTAEANEAIKKMREEENTPPTPNQAGSENSEMETVTNNDLGSSHEDINLINFRPL